MFESLAKSLFGSSNDRAVKNLHPVITKINDLEDGLSRLDDEALRAMTVQLRDRLAQGETKDDLLAEAFALVREAAKRTLGQRHFDVQLMDAIAREHLHGVQERLGRLRSMEKELKRMVHECSGGKVEKCRIIEVLADHSKCLTTDHPMSESPRRQNGGTGQRRT